MAYKVVSKIIGEIRINNKTLGYDSFIIIDDITPEIDVLRQNKVIKVSNIQIKSKDKKNINTEIIKENKSKNKNSETKENKDK